MNKYRQKEAYISLKKCEWRNILRKKELGYKKHIKPLKNISSLFCTDGVSFLSISAQSKTGISKNRIVCFFSNFRPKFEPV